MRTLRHMDTAAAAVDIAGTELVNLRSGTACKTSNSDSGVAVEEGACTTTPAVGAAAEVQGPPDTESRTPGLRTKRDTDEVARTRSLPPAARMDAHTIAAVVALAAIGSAIGGAVRTVMSLYVSPWTCAKCSITDFPASTFIVNMAGSVILGLLARLSMEWSWDPTVLAAFGAGFTGGLTTLSSFVVDTVKLFHAGKGGTAVVYFLSTSIGCLCVAYLAWLLGGVGRPSTG